MFGAGSSGRFRLSSCGAANTYRYRAHFFEQFLPHKSRPLPGRRGVSTVKTVRLPIGRDDGIRMRYAYKSSATIFAAHTAERRVVRARSAK